MSNRSNTVGRALGEVLRSCEVVDNHCHGFRLERVADLDSAGFEDRLTMMGMCRATSGQTVRRQAAQVTELRDATVFALTARRWLAAYLGVSARSQAVAEARGSALAADAQGYVNALLVDQHICAVIADDGYPQPAITRAEFEKTLGVSVYRVARIEPWIADLQRQELAFGDFEAAFEQHLDEAAADSFTLGYKSVIAYRTGLDVTRPSTRDASEAYEEWRRGRWATGRGPGKTVRDYLLWVTLRAAQRHERVVHIHCGGGDPDIVLTHARPGDLYPFLHAHEGQPIVLIHAGWPWLSEGAYIASILPSVYLDLSEFLPWASLAIDRELELLLGVAPAGKLLYGSDEASEPEVLWLSAKMTREALIRVLETAIERDQLTMSEAERIGTGVLALNSRRLHGISLRRQSCS